MIHMLPHCCRTALNKPNLKNTPNTSYYELYNPKTYTYIYQRSALLKVHSTKNSTKITQECCTTTLRTRWKKNCREWAITSMSRCGNASDNAQKFSGALQMQTTMTLFPNTAMSSIPNAVKGTTLGNWTTLQMPIKEDLVSSFLKPKCIRVNCKLGNRIKHESWLQTKPKYQYQDWH